MPIAHRVCQSSTRLQRDAELFIAESREHALCGLNVEGSSPRLLYLRAKHRGPCLLGCAPSIL